MGGLGPPNIFNMLPLEEYRYIYPPRPETALPAANIQAYERKGEYLAQPKLNGDCMVVFMNGLETIIMDRHKEIYTKCIVDVSPLYRETIADGKPTNKWMAVVGEYMVKSQKDRNNKVWNHKFVIHDIIAYDGMQLIGKTMEQRVELLDMLYGKDDTEFIKKVEEQAGDEFSWMGPDRNDGVRQLDYIYTTGVKDCYRVKTYRDCLEKLWSDLVKIGMYEGLVLKRAKSKLEPGNRVANNTSSMVKFRKETKNYTH